MNYIVKPGLKKPKVDGWWWHTPLIPRLRRQRQVYLCEFKASLVYREFQDSQGNTENPYFGVRKKKRT